MGSERQFNREFRPIEVKFGKIEVSDARPIGMI